MNNIALRTINRRRLYSISYKTLIIKAAINWSIICLFVGIAMWGSSAYAQIQEGFPYMAKVSVQNVAARSGPGVTYYPTQALPVGSVVEVYCELPTGWAAIRPPQGSFSWVRGKFLEVQADGTGRITEDNTASGVGSDLFDSRDVVQVRMRKDERVEVIQKTSIGTEEWYRISPPSGEFRWVNLNDILPDDPIRRTPQQTQRSQNPSSVAFSPVTAPGSGFSPGQYGQPPAPGFRRPHGRLSDDEFYRELAELERAWSAMFHTKPDNWHSALLLQRARFLKTQANSERKLARVDLLIARLEKANQMEIAAGVPQPGMMHRPYGMYRPYDVPGAPPANPLLDPSTLPAGAKATVLPGLESTQAEFNQAGLPPPPGAAPYELMAQHNMAALAQADELEKTMRLDGVGLLAQLPQGNVDRLPIRWALLDVNGQVRYYVSPALGVVFKGLEGRVVGVIGSREFLPNNDQRLHITVRHIRPL